MRDSRHSRDDEETEEHENSSQLEAEPIVEMKSERIETVEEQRGQKGHDTLRGCHQTEQPTCTRQDKTAGSCDDKGDDMLCTWLRRDKTRQDKTRQDRWQL